VHGRSPCRPTAWSAYSSVAATTARSCDPRCRQRLNRAPLARRPISAVVDTIRPGGRTLRLLAWWLYREHEVAILVRPGGRTLPPSGVRTPFAVTVLPAPSQRPGACSPRPSTRPSQHRPSCLNSSNPSPPKQRNISRRRLRPSLAVVMLVGASTSREPPNVDHDGPPRAQSALDPAAVRSVRTRRRQLAATPNPPCPPIRQRADRPLLTTTGGWPTISTSPRRRLGP
jgi:hypothetical protein